MAKRKTKRKGKAKKRKTAADHYEAITNRIIEMMESDGVAPWHRPWKASLFGSVPMNVTTRKPYRGVNVLTTLMTQWKRDYDFPLWLTLKQATEIAVKAARKAGHKVEQNARGRWVYADGENKGKVVRGIREGQNKANGAGSTEIIFWQPYKRKEEDDNGNERFRRSMLLRAFQVFNIEQCEAAVVEYLIPGVVIDEDTGKVIHVPNDAPEFKPLDAAEAIVEGFEIETRHGGDRAYYSPREDRIQMPKREAFDTPEHYYTTRFHEIGHATGHASRLGREGIAGFDYFGSHKYATEELVAEFTAAFLAGEAGIERTVEDNSAAYLKSWAKRLKEDKSIIYKAARDAQKAADFVMGREAPGAKDEAEDSKEAA
jgi:antirestriction protein ArdC